MRRAKVFTNGRSQAIRLPKEFRFDAPEVFVRRDEITGDVILSARQPEFTWASFFESVREVPEEERREFLATRTVIEGERKDLF